MGGEGASTGSTTRCSRRCRSVFQNLGDGTYWHSGYLAIPPGGGPKATITYKILFNDAVAMTGGQPVDGAISVDRIAPGGARAWRKVVVVSDDIAKYDARMRPYSRPAPVPPPRPRSTRCSACRRATAGVTVLIYEQTCAAEKRRRRKKGEMARPGAARLHQRTGLRGLRRLHGAEQLRCRAAARDAAGPQAPHRPERLQQGLFLREGLLPEFRRRAGRHAAQEVGCLSEAGAANAEFERRCRAARCRRRTVDRAPTTCWSPASAAPAWSPWAR